MTGPEHDFGPKPASEPEHASSGRSSAPRSGLRYLCVCGYGVALHDDPQQCPECGRAIPRGLGEDPTLTLTLCIPMASDEADRDSTPLGDASGGTVVSGVETSRDSAGWASGSANYDGTHESAPQALTPGLDAPTIAHTPDAGGGSEDGLSGDAVPSERARPEGSKVGDSGYSPSRVSQGTGGVRTGERLGHFVLQESLGMGGMGSVYRALDTSLERYVAVKVLRGASDGSTTASGKQTDRLRREAVAQARLNHPRVVTIYYVGREGEEPFLAMELLPGPTLQQRLTDGPLAYHEVIHFALQVTDALEAADQSGLVHGDIKPSNLLMAGGDSIKLSDFGLSRRSGAAESRGAVSGTPQYMAPELVQGNPPDRRSDMYALGVTLFELAFGRRPFDLRGDTLRQQLQTHERAEIEFPEKWPAEIPESFREVLAKLLAKDPDERYESYPGLRGDLRAVAPVGSTPAGRLPRAIAWATDLMILAVLQTPLVLPNFIMGAIGDSGSSEYADWGVPVPYSLVEFFFGLLALFGLLAIPALTLWWDLKRWRTPGRYLLQLRVVDEHGLPPPRRVLILRNVMRYMEFWVAALFCLPLVFSLPLASLVEETLGRVWMLVDALFIFGPLRRTLHDRLCRTHVVLDDRSIPRLKIGR